MTLSAVVIKRKVTKVVNRYFGHRLERIGDLTYKSLDNREVLDRDATKWLMENGYIRTNLNATLNNVFFMIELSPHGLTYLDAIDGFADPLKKKKKRK